MNNKQKLQKAIKALLPYAKNFPTVKAELEKYQQYLDGQREFSQEEYEDLIAALVALCSNLGIDGSTFIGRIIAKKSFWTGLMSIGAGVALIVFQQYAEGITAIAIGIGTIVNGDASKKAEIEANKAAAITIAAAK